MAGDNNTFAKAETGVLQVVNVTIPNGAAISNFINMNAFTLVGIKFPAAMTSTTVTLQDSLDGVTFEDAYNTSDALLSWTFTQGRFYKLFAYDTASWVNLKIKVDSNEAAERELTLVLRGV